MESQTVLDQAPIESKYKIRQFSNNINLLRIFLIFFTAILANFAKPNPFHLPKHETLDAPLWLIYADTENKNWRAYLDNIKQDIYSANLAFKAVQRPPGSHAVNFLFSKSTLLYKLFFTLQILLGLGIISTIFSYPFNKSLQQAIDK